MRPAMRVSLLLVASALGALGAAVSGARELIPDELAKPVFKEIWAYLLQGEEKELSGAEPITDLCYFAASLTREGRITDAIARPTITLKDGLRPRVDLVIAELSNASLMHFSLDPDFGVRPLLIDDICRVSDPFDGVQIDFESVSRDDAEYFFGFLQELKARLPAGKRLSIAIPARTGPVADAYDYARIAPIVDRVVIMAYDEHWSTSEPGPVASLPWCAKVVDYAQSVVANAKIVMGLPLYGRAWQDKRLAKALRFKNVQDLVAETKSTPSYAADLGAWFEYSESVRVKVFYDDNRTILEKLELYRARSISSVSFWRIGQGPPELWSSIEHEDVGTATDVNGGYAESSSDRAESSAPGASATQ